MIFDDHEICNDWNISAAWVADMRAQPWWEECITSGLASYWLYQPLGNLSPEELAADPVYREVLEAPDATGVLREHARRSHRGEGGWCSSHHRDLGGTRLVAIDSRNARVLEPGRRAMLTEDGWRWAGEHLTGGVDHLVVATSLPFALPHGAHHLEALSEALGEGRRGAAPESIALLSGDVHYAYLAELLPARPGASPIYQAVCSPFRNELSGRLRLATRLAFTAPMALALRALAHLAGVEPDAVAWRILGGPYFGTQVGTLELEGRSARLRIERAVVGNGGVPRLEPLLEHGGSGGLKSEAPATVESPS